MTAPTSWHSKGLWKKKKASLFCCEGNDRNAREDTLDTPYPNQARTLGRDGVVVVDSGHHRGHELQENDEIPMKK